MRAPASLLNEAEQSRLDQLSACILETLEPPLEEFGHGIGYQEGPSVIVMALQVQEEECCVLAQAQKLVYLGESHRNDAALADPVAALDLHFPYRGGCLNDLSVRDRICRVFCQTVVAIGRSAVDQCLKAVAMSGGATTVVEERPIALTLRH